MEFHSTVTFTSNPVSFAIFTDPNLFGCFALEFLATLYFVCRTAPGPSQHKKLLRLFSCHDPSSWKAAQMIWRSHWMLMSLYVSSVSVWDVLKIYTSWRQRNSFKLIPSRREKVLFICTEWADISKRNYMNRLFLVRLRPVQSPEVIMPQSPAWRPKQWQCY